MNAAEPDDDEIMMFIVPSDLVEIGLGHTVGYDYTTSQGYRKVFYLSQIGLVCG